MDETIRNLEAEERDEVQEFINDITRRSSDKEFITVAVGFAKDAQEDPIKVKAIKKFRSKLDFDINGKPNFDAYRLLDLYDNLLEKANG